MNKAKEFQDALRALCVRHNVQICPYQDAFGRNRIAVRDWTSNDPLEFADLVDKTDAPGDDAPGDGAEVRPPRCPTCNSTDDRTGDRGCSDYTFHIRRWDD